MTDVPDKIARAKELIEQKKRELAENIKKKNEEAKRKEREKEIEKHKKEVEKIKLEKGIPSKVKVPEQLRMDFEKEKIASEQKAENDSKNRDFESIPQKLQKTELDKREEDLAPQKFKVEQKLDSETNSLYISDFDSESGTDLIEKRVPDLKCFEPKPLIKQAYLPIAELEAEHEVSYKIPKKEPNIESLETDAQDKLIEDQKLVINHQESPVHSSILKASICEDKLNEEKNSKQKLEKNKKFLENLSKIMEEEGFLVQQKQTKKSQVFTIFALRENPGAKNKIFSSREMQKNDFKEDFTPSFSEKDKYDQFETFGIQKPIITIKPSTDLILIENKDDEIQTEKQKKKIENLRSKRLSELEKRYKKPSPENLLRVEKHRYTSSPNTSPKPSPQPSPRPSRQESGNSPVPNHKTREEIKSMGDKYKRHKNLPNLVYNKPTNRKIVKNAIAQVCLAGEPNKGPREKILSLIERLSEINYFIIVFSDPIRRDVRGLYSHEPNTGEVLKVYGPGYLPDLLDSSAVTNYFRYDSGAREFKLLTCKDFIVGTDAVCLKKFHKVYENN